MKKRKGRRVWLIGLASRFGSGDELTRLRVRIPHSPPKLIRGGVVELVYTTGFQPAAVLSPLG